jgi:NADP-dependent 3-hydroxy acid dehydrogenase YdfG
VSGVLTGKTALVTGASSGIGRSTALALANAGANVALVARRADRLKDLAAQIEADGGQALARAADVTDEQDATRAVEDAVGHFGGLDILVNAAGMTQTGKVENGDLADWRYVFELNFWAGFYTARAAIPALKAKGGGDIVNISSTAGRRAVGATFGPYAASKFALTAFNESLRAEVTLAGIRVSIIEPGATATEIHEHIKDEKVREFTRNHVEKDGAMLAGDVAAAVVFVVSLPPRVNVSQLVIRPSVDTRVL